MIEMQKLEGFEVNICGDFYELIVICNTDKCEQKIKEITGESEFTLKSENQGRWLMNLKYSAPLEKTQIHQIKEIEGVTEAFTLTPVLPTHSRAGCSVPYSNAQELLDYAKEHPMEAWEYGAYYESVRGGVSKEAVFAQMDQILSVMEAAVDQGLSGTYYKDRILGAQSHQIETAEKEGKLVPCNPLNMVIKSITAVMETKSSMGLIVAAPTCGSCGCLPGTVIGLGRAMGLPREEMIKGLFAAGIRVVR